MMVVEMGKSPPKTYWDKFVSSLRHTKTSAMQDVEQRQIQVERKNETPRELHPYTDHDETATRNKNPKAKKHCERQTYIQTEKAREKEELINSGAQLLRFCHESENDSSDPYEESKLLHKNLNSLIRERPPSTQPKGRE